MKKNVKGITLIALVVTIIVLLILAGIAINLTIGNNGLFSRAQNASNIWKKSEANERDEMKNFENLYDETLNNLGFVEDDSIVNFTINEEKYTVAKGTTWYDFFHENFPNDWESWIYLVDSGEICYVTGVSSTGVHAYVVFLRNELNEIQIKDNEIKNGKYVYKTGMGDREEVVSGGVSTF